MNKNKEIVYVCLLIIGAIFSVVGFFIDINALNMANAIDAVTNIEIAVQAIVRDHIQAHALIAVGAYVVGIVGIFKILDSKEE